MFDLSYFLLAQDGNVHIVHTIHSALVIWTIEVTIWVEIGIAASSVMDFSLNNWWTKVPNSETKEKLSLPDSQIQIQIFASLEVIVMWHDNIYRKFVFARIQI